MGSEFKSRLIEQAKRLVTAADHCLTEEAAKFSLVAPFLEFLGYDVRNPAEVRPEHAADFSEKYRNRVDFAILKDGEPLIAIECKGVGVTRTDDRGQLKAYFNAAKSVRVGILTDGVVWECFADSDEPNLLDDTAFLTIDLREVAAGKVTDQVVEGLQQLSKAAFDPENIGAEAKRKLIFQSFVLQLESMAEAPSEKFCRLLLEGVGMKNVRSARMQEYEDLARRAFQAFVDGRILSRLDLKPTPQQAQPATTAAVDVVAPKVATTEGELAVFDYVRRRLAFLVTSENEFEAIQRIEWRDYASKFGELYT